MKSCLVLLHLTLQNSQRQLMTKLSEWINNTAETERGIGASEESGVMAQIEYADDVLICERKCRGSRPRVRRRRIAGCPRQPT